jgi:hypothetical protein
MLDSSLAKKYQTEIHLGEKQYDDKKIPWFISLGIKDSVFDSISHIGFWVMEYKQEYFDYNHYKHDNKKLTRINYLSTYEEERKNKILKRFTSITTFKRCRYVNISINRIRFYDNGCILLSLGKITYEKNGNKSQ